MDAFWPRSISKHPVHAHHGPRVTVEVLVALRAGQRLKVAGETPGSHPGPCVLMDGLAREQAQKAFQVGVENRARDVVMVQGACESGDPGRHLTGFDHGGIDKDHGNQRLG